MENKKFCKFCGEKIDKNLIICPKCGRQLEIVKETKELKENIEEKKIESKIYEKEWFMWLMLFIFTPVGLFLLWKYNSKMKKGLKIILTIVFTVFFLYELTTINGTSTTENNNIETNNKISVTVIDFSSMASTDIESWCNENKITCKITNEYSDTIAKNSFVSQSVATDNKINQGETLTIVYSLGAKPSIEYLNALAKAESYSKIMYMSKKGIYDQLTSDYGEKFSAAAAQYAIDNMKADWNANALSKAKTYQTTMSMSKSAIYDQLISDYGEKFTAEEAQYAVDHLDN